jgi:hypothetical protein
MTLSNSHFVALQIFDMKPIIFCYLLANRACNTVIRWCQRSCKCEMSACLKGILSTKIVIFSYPKLLLFSVLTFIKWRLTPSYAAKDTIFWQKRPKTIVIRIIVLDDKNSNLFIWSSMWTRLEHAHCLETIFNMWFLGKRECQRVEESGLSRIQRERWIEVKYFPNGTNAGYM